MRSGSVATWIVPPRLYGMAMPLSVVTRVVPAFRPEWYVPVAPWRDTHAALLRLFKELT